MSENQNLIDYYSNLLIIQYADKPKAKAVMNTLIGELMTYDVAIAVRDAFDPNTAIGVQLDIVAKYVGVSRIITGTTFTRVYFGYMAYGEIAPFAFPGFIGYGDPVPDEQIRDYKESTQSLYALTDEELRVIIKLAIVKNYSNASVKDIDEILDTLFGSEVYFNDHLDMTIVSFLVGTNLSRIFNIAKSSGLLPKPAGVGTSIAVVPDINNIFAYSSYGGMTPSFAIGYAKYIQIEKMGDSLDTGRSNNSFDCLKEMNSVFLDINSGSAPLVTYYFDGEKHVTINTSNLNLPDIQKYLCALTETRIAIAFPGSTTLQAYDFNGTSWVTVGSGKALSTLQGGHLSRISNTRVILTRFYNTTVSMYDFDGSTWALVGNDLSILAIDSFKLSGAENLVVIQTATNTQAYSFDGTNFTAVGSPLTYSSTGYRGAYLSDNEFVMVSYAGQIERYIFNGTDFILKEIYLTGIVGSSGSFGIGQNSSKAFTIVQEGIITRYEKYQDLVGCIAAYSGS